MESTAEIEWNGDAEERFSEKAIARQEWGTDNGHSNLGRKLIQEVRDKINEISGNLNLYPVRSDDERVAPLSSGYVLIYKKVYFKDAAGATQVKLLLIDVRKHY